MVQLSRVGWAASELDRRGPDARTTLRALSRDVIRDRISFADVSVSPPPSLPGRRADAGTVSGHGFSGQRPLHEGH